MIPTERDQGRNEAAAEAILVMSEYHALLCKVQITLCDVAQLIDGAIKDES